MTFIKSFLCGSDSNESAYSTGDLGEDPLEKGTAPIPVFLPEEFHGQRSLAGYLHGVAKSWT